MKTSYRLIYIFASFACYVLLGLIEFFFLTHLLDIISTGHVFHYVMMVICLLFINPLITYLLLDLLPIKPRLRLKGNIHEDLKREV
ncbi:MAG: hypothetical protein IJJ00_00645 [Erysipelotrichaceae bacterium]|nr:hypothetical protein [Erysipelotrichaceae bacterium]